MRSKAIQSPHGKELGGRPLRVNEAQERTGGGGNRGGAAPKLLVASRLPRAGRACCRHPRTGLSIM